MYCYSLLKLCFNNLFIKNQNNLIYVFKFEKQLFKVLVALKASLLSMHILKIEAISICICENYIPNSKYEIIISYQHYNRFQTHRRKSKCLVLGY